jgi:transcriptional regulator with XRE-family HTH domain
METFAERLRHAMVVRGVTKQMAFAAELQVDDSAVSRWRRGGGMSVEHAARFCQILDVSLDWLVLGRGTIDLHKVGSATRPSVGVRETVQDLPKPVADALVVLVEAVRTETSRDH